MSKKILIIEDAKPLVKALTLKLANAGFDVKSAYNGWEALNILAQETFDLILLDLILPKMDGFKVMEELKKQEITVPIFVLTNLGQQEDRKKAEQLGAREFMIKSDTPLIEVVKRVKSFFNKK